MTTRKKPKLGPLVREGPVDLGKLDLGLRRAIDRAPEEVIDVIIRVRTADHVPAGVDLRGRITSQTLTARVRVGDLVQVAQDPEVLSVAGSEPLPLVPPKREPEPR